MTITSILKKTDLFKALPDEALDELAQTLRPRTIKAGEILFNMSDPGDELIIIQEGKIAIYVPVKNHPETGQAIRIFQAGDMLGEMALIDRLTRSTSARAEVDTIVLSLDSQTFESLLDKPEVALGVMRGLSDRLRYTTNFIGELRQWVQRMAEGNYQAIPDQMDCEDTSLAALAADFIRMSTQVREREEKLQQEVAHLRIEIDEQKRKQEVSQITESEYYRSLKDKLRALREEDDD